MMMVDTANETPVELSDKYTYQRLLGEGANGKTWLAVVNGTKEQVAVKQLKLSKTDNLKSYDLFMREAEVLRSLRHQGIPKFYDCIVSDDGRCYLIQEYVAHSSLQQILDELGRLDERSVLDMMSHVADILVALHMQYSPPVVHRDIKPSNILCSYDRSRQRFGKLCLIDFGAVANPQVKSSGSTVAGTFGYMAPEQLLGDVTMQSDYYALGATALHCLTGIAPYRMPTKIFRILLDEVLQAHAPDVSPQMHEFLSILLAPDRSDRPQHARALRSMLRNVDLGRMPRDDAGGSVCDSFLLDQQKIFGNEFTRTVQQSDMKRWHVAYGMVRHIQTGMTVKKYEYIDRITNDVYVSFSKKGRQGYECRHIMEYKCACVEYTFEVLGEPCCGTAMMYQGAKDEVSDRGLDRFSDEWAVRKLPFNCLVRYDPKNPGYSYIDLDA